MHSLTYQYTVMQAKCHYPVPFALLTNVMSRSPLESDLDVGVGTAGWVLDGAEADADWGWVPIQRGYDVSDHDFFFIGQIRVHEDHSFCGHGAFWKDVS